MSRRTGRSHDRAMSDVPMEIDGMRVVIDKRVTLFPVTLVEQGRKEEYDAGRAMAGAASRTLPRRPRRTNGSNGHGR